MEGNPSRAFKCCSITNVLDGTEDETVWDNEGEEAEDLEEAIDSEYEMESKGNQE